MKKLFAGITIILSTISILAQSPPKMSYQAVMRDVGGKLIINQAFGIRISILQGSATGTEVYKEIYNPNPQTNANGLVTIEIGNGVALTGTFSTINWANGPYFIKTESDPMGGTTYTNTGVSQLLSVPYALYAKTAENGFSGSYNDLTNKPTLFDGKYISLTGTPILKTVATSGNYNDLTNKPTLFDGKYASLKGIPALSAIATTGSYSDLLNKPLQIDTNTIVKTYGNQSIIGTKTFNSDLLVNGITIGKGKSSGYYNTVFGTGCLYTSGGTYNTAFGYFSLPSITNGGYNTAYGPGSLYSTTSGNANSALGNLTLYGNTAGENNSAFGNQAMQYNSTGSNNTAMGYMALQNNRTGSNNTAIGYSADVYSGDLTNAAAIGYLAVVNASNKVVIGNSNVTTIGGYANWSNYSDKRLKENIVYKNDLGLNFITKLKPASYNYSKDALKHRRDGLIAQDVQQTLKELNIEFSGLVVDDDKDKTLNLAYGDFVIPLINAVQELSKQNNEMKEEIALLKALVEKK